MLIADDMVDGIDHCRYDVTASLPTPNTTRKRNADAADGPIWNTTMEGRDSDLWLCMGEVDHVVDCIQRRRGPDRRCRSWTNRPSLVLGESEFAVLLALSWGSMNDSRRRGSC